MTEKEKELLSKSEKVNKPHYPNFYYVSYQIWNLYENEIRSLENKGYHFNQKMMEL